MPADPKLDWATRKVVMEGAESSEGERHDLNKGGTWNAGPGQGLDKTWVDI
jgi:hypothetical protein